MTPDAKRPESDRAEIIACAHRHPREQVLDCGTYRGPSDTVILYHQVLDVTEYAASTATVLAQQAFESRNYDACPGPNDARHANEPSFRQVDDFLSPLAWTT